MGHDLRDGAREMRLNLNPVAEQDQTSSIRWRWGNRNADWSKSTLHRAPYRGGGWCKKKQFRCLCPSIRTTFSLPPSRCLTTVLYDTLCHLHRLAVSCAGALLLLLILWLSTNNTWQPPGTSTPASIYSPPSAGFALKGRQVHSDTRCSILHSEAM